MFVILYLGVLHHREKQAGLSTDHNGGTTHHLPATSPEATRKNIHVNKLCSICSAFFHKVSLSTVLMASCIGGSQSIEVETADNNTAGYLQYSLYAKGQTIIFLREEVWTMFWSMKFFSHTYVVHDIFGGK